MRTKLLGVKIIIEAVEEPLRQMALNAGESPDIIVNQVINNIICGPYGYNFVTRKIEELYKIAEL